ncbi:MAG TPA: protein kinase [Myxococcales bacterium]|nr:protein kinase [Myxococcales bacterium]
MASNEPKPGVPTELVGGGAAPSGGAPQPAPAAPRPSAPPNAPFGASPGAAAIAQEIAAELAETAQRPVPRPQPAEPEDELIGTTIGSFRIVRRLGKGGMGTVYLGEQTVIGSKVAVKILHPHLASNHGLVQRFYAEARAVNLIGHENIVSIFDMNVVPPSRYYLIMEYLEGKPLTSLLKGPLAPSVAIPILSQVCDALQAAHSHGVVHRDLKPENIFLIKRGRNEHFVKILDFGIAKLYAQQQDLPGQVNETAAGMLVGTPEYMSPEQCTGAAVDGRADVYTLGIISYLLATGRLPFSGGGLTSLLLAHREQIPPTPHDVNPKVPVPWSSVTMQALAKRPQDRFQDAGEMRDALERALESTKPRQSSSVGRAEIPTPDPAPSQEVLRTPQPSDSRHTASFMATVSGTGIHEMARLRCVDISRGGVFLCAEGPLPPVFSRVKLALEIGEGSLLKCDAEVVRHVTAEQARAWNMSPGFGVQFVDTSPAFREAVARAVQGLPVDKTAPASRGQDDDAAAEPLLDHYRKRINGDHYVVLSMAPDSEIADLRARSRDARRDLESLRLRRLSARQEGQALVALERLNAATEVLGTPIRRAEYDAHRGNFKGVARCISAGLTVSDLESLRGAYLSSHRGTDSRAQIHFSTGQAWETKGSFDEALAEYERALVLDPLNLRFHHRYWALKRRVTGPKR